MKIMPHVQNIFFYKNKCNPQGEEYQRIVCRTLVREDAHFLKILNSDEEKKIKMRLDC